MNFSSTKLSIFSSDIATLGTLYLVFALAVLVVNPMGDFPLNDDFQYAYPVMTLFEDGKYEVAHSFAPNIFLQVLWGYLCCLLAGEFSYTTLRFSTLILAMVALTYLYKILSLNSDERKWPFYLTLLFVFTPVFFLSSFSFMTEVPFIAMTSAAIYYYLLCIRSDHQRHRLLGFIFAMAAFLIRQPGLLIVFCFEAMYGWRHWRQNQSVKLSLIYSCIALVFYVFVNSLLMDRLQVTDKYQSIVTVYGRVLWENPGQFIYRQLKYNTYTLVMMGFYFLPLLGSCLILLRKFLPAYERWKWILLVASGIAALLMWWLGHQFPFNGSILRNFVLGVNLLIDWTWAEQSLPSLPAWLLFPLSILAIFSGIILLITIWTQRHQPFITFLVLLAVLYQLSMTIFSYTDRYFIWTLLVFVIALSHSSVRYLKWHFYLPLTFLVFISVAGTKDYLQWNRLVKDHYSAMIDGGVLPNQIDAGMPINSHFSHIHPWNEMADYRFSFTRDRSLEVKDSISFFRYLTWEEDQIYILGE